MRVAAEFIGQAISAQIMAREGNSESDHQIQLKVIYSELLRHGGEMANLSRVFVEKASLFLSLMDAQGAALCQGDGKFECIGQVPKSDVISRICGVLEKKGEPVFATKRISEIGESSPEVFAKAAGVLAVAGIYEPTPRIIWFRPELQEQIPWSGNPHLTKEKSEDGRLHPRKSFETWLENVNGCSKSWTLSQMETAYELSQLFTSMRQGVGRKELAVLPPVASDTKKAHALADMTAWSWSEGVSEIALFFLDLNGSIQQWSEGARHLLVYSYHNVWRVYWAGILKLKLQTWVRAAPFSPGSMPDSPMIRACFTLLRRKKLKHPRAKSRAGN